MEPSMDINTKLEKYQIKMRFKKNLTPIDQEVQELTKNEAQKNKALYPDKKNFLYNYFSEIKVQKLLSIVGDQGRYQKILMIILCAYNFFYAFIGFQLGYLYYQPDFYCYDEQYIASKCTQNQACSNPYGFYTESQINSIVTQFKLYCNNQNEIYVTQAIFIILGGMIAFIFGVLSDVIGRQKVFIFAWIFSTLGISLSLFSDTLTLTTVGLVFGWAGMDMFFSMVFIYVNEILGGSLREKSNAILFFFWALGEIVINLINIVQLIPLLLLAPFFYFIRESPYVLFKVRNIKRLFNVLYFIGKENKKNKEQIFNELSKELKIEELDVSGIDVLRTLKIQKKIDGKPKKSDTFKQFLQSYVKLFSSKTRTLKLIGVCILASHLYIGYALSILIPQRLGLSNIYINGVFLGISELIGNFLVIPIGDKINRRTLNFCCSLGITILCGLLFILGLFKHSISENLLQWLETILGSSIKLVICMNFAMIFTYIAELFPTRIRGLGLGFCVLAGRLSTIFALGVESFTDHFDLNPMVGVIFGAIVSMPVALLLPETFGKGIDN